MKILLISLFLVILTVVCDESDPEVRNPRPWNHVGPWGQPGYPQGEPGYPQGQPGYPQGQPGYPQGQPGYPESEPGYPMDMTMLNYWRLFFEGPESFAVTPAGVTNLTFYLAHTCRPEPKSVLASISVNSSGLNPKPCNGLIATLGSINFTITTSNGMTGYLYVDKLSTKETNINGNTIVAASGLIVSAMPTICTGTYILAITIFLANDQNACTSTGLKSQTTIFSTTLLYGKCSAICDLKEGNATFNPPVSITGLGPAVKLP